MPGIIDLKDFTDAANRGQLTPQLGGTGSGGAGGSPPVATGGLGGGSAGRLPPPLANILKQILVSDVKSRFSTGTDPSGAKWRPLKHARPNGGDVPLRDTGILMASFSGGTDGNSVWVGTTHPGAALHNFGGVVRGRGKMLAIPLTKEAKRSGGPRRWKNGKLVFRPTRKPRVFLLLGADRPKKPKAKRRGKKGRVGAAIDVLRKRIAKVRKAVGKRAKKLVKGTRRAKKRGASRGAEGLLRKLLGKLRSITAKNPDAAAAGGAAGQSLVAQFLLVDEVTIPKREFMGVSEKAWGQITDAVAEATIRGWLNGPLNLGTSVG
jgi:phage gpG-like protein